jgi:ABC-type lipoprotein release transport system permease subunit
MLWLKFGWRNLRRNKFRTALGLTAISGAVFLCLFLNSLALGSYNQMIENGIRSGSGHIGLYNPQYLDTREAEYMHSSKKSELLTCPHVKHVLQRIMIPALARSAKNSQGAVLVGMEPEAEAQINPVIQPRFLLQGHWPEQESSKDAAIGARLLEKLGIRLGQKLVVTAQDLNGEINSQLLRVRGIFQTGMSDFDSSTIITGLKPARKLLRAKEMVHETAVFLDSMDSIPDALKSLQPYSTEEMHVYHWREAMPQITSMIKMDRINGLMMFAFLFAIVSIGTINLMVMSVMERTREFGVMRALGVTRSQIRFMILSEGFVISVVGIVLGVIAAYALNQYTSVHGIDFSGYINGNAEAGGILIEPIVYTAWKWSDGFFCIFTMLLLGCTGSLYPASIAMKTLPAEALKQ